MAEESGSTNVSPGVQGEDEQPSRDREDATEDDEAARVRERIERTRSQMGGTVDALEERLSPARLKEQVTELKEHVVGQIRDVKGQLKDDLRSGWRDAGHVVESELRHAKDAVRDATVGRVEHAVHEANVTIRRTGWSIVETVRNNPIPFTMIGVGLAWLVGSRAKRAKTVARSPAGGERYDGGERPGQLARGVEERTTHVAHDAGERATQLAGDAREQAAHLAGEARNRVAHAARDAREEAGRIESAFERTYRDDPLVLGLVVATAGAAVGVALPRTRREDELLGAARDRVMARATGLFDNSIERAERAVAEKLAEPARQGRSAAGAGV